MTTASRLFRSIIKTVPLVLGAVLMLSLQQARASTWNSSTVDNATAESGQYCSMAVDPNGKLHVGYLDTNGTYKILKYATNAGGSWATESLQAYINDIYPASTSTVYTPGGPRIMAYSRNQATGTYKYQAVRKILGDGWQLQDIAGGKWPYDTGEPMHWDQMPINSIATGTKTGAIQKEGFTYITFSDGNMLWFANEKTYAYNYFAGTGAISQSDLGADSSGDIHIVSYNPTASGLPQGLLYSLNNTAPVAVPNATGVTLSPTIAVDSANTLHVVYIDASYNIKYLNKTASGWSTPVTVANVGQYGGHLSMKADKVNGLHMAYYQSTDAPAQGAKGVLYYVNRSPAGSWSAIDKLDPASASTNYGQFTSLVVDGNNVVSIAYYDVKRSKLAVATKPTGNINVAPAPVYFGNVQEGAGFAVTKNVTVTNRGLANLTLAASNAVTLSGTNASQFTILNNTCTNGKILTTTSPGNTCTMDVKLTVPTGSSGTKTANLVIASNDPVTSSKSVELRGISEVNPISHTIHATAGTGGTISPSGDVTVPYYANQSFAISQSPGFLVQSVTIDGINVGTLTSYTFNEVVADHTIAVTFSPVTPVALWSIEEVDNDVGGVTSNTGKYCSMALDGNGKIYIGYMDLTSATPILKYATNKAGPWVLENVAAIPNVTDAGTATVFSQGVGPRIMAYSYDSSTGARKYGAARKWTETAPPGGNLNDWQLQWVAGDFFPAQYGGGPQPPIYNTTFDTFTGAVQYNGYTFITYTDGNNLWYANEKDFYYLKLDAANSIAGAGKQSDLVLDPDANIHIVYYTPGASGTGELRYGMGQGGYTDPVNNPPVYTESVLITGVTSDPAITIDGQRTLHVVYVQSGRVKYLRGALVNSVRTWDAPYDLGPCGSNGAYTSIEANGLDIIHVAYYSKTGSYGNVMYAQRLPSGSWSIPAQVWATGEPSGADVGQYAALVVDNHHNVHIAYYDATRTSLKVAHKQIPVISVTPDPGNFTAGTSVVFTVKNAGYVTTLSIGAAVLSGTDAGHFQITGNTCNGANLLPYDTSSQTCTITVTADSSLANGMTASLDIPSNDSYTQVKSVPLLAPSDTILWFKLVNTGTYYNLLQGAYAAALDTYTIWGQAVRSAEDLLFSSPYSISLIGGYDTVFGSQIGTTSLSSVTVTAGTVDMNAVVFE